MACQEYYELYLALGPEETHVAKNKVSEKTRRWALLLRNNKTTTWDGYSCIGGPHSSGPNKHTPYNKVQRNKISLNDAFLGVERVWLARIEARDWQKFDSTFMDQVSWQSQYFVVGYLYDLARLGVVDWSVANEWARKAKYTHAELEVLSQEGINNIAREIADVARTQPVSVYSSVVGYVVSWVK
ncbi:hypothetical protein BJY00DRAFT_310378 [Aspergillus carlsbadensis]|nr:hypothetical protein BJY00DRAFT_310378 [Aspergillus carlsbadensis]